MLTVGYRTVSATLILFSYNPTATKRSTQQYRFTSVAQYGTKNRFRDCFFNCYVLNLLSTIKKGTSTVSKFAQYNATTTATMPAKPFRNRLSPFWIFIK
jgi:hypothetical protein